MAFNTSRKHIILAIDYIHICYGQWLSCVLQLQVLDRYIHDSIDGAQQSSAEASDSASDTDSTANASEASSVDEEQSLQNQAQADMATLRVADGAERDSLTLCAASHHDAATDVQSADPQADSDFDSQHGRRQPRKQLHHSDDLLPDHVLMRSGEAAAQTQAAAPPDDDADDGDVVSHIDRRPGQAAVQQRVLDQHRSRLRKQMLARATRNAQKGGSKKDRKQAAGQVDW